MNPKPPHFTHYLRLEGVNLDAFVGDTRQLSVNRGGSLKLLAAVEAVQSKLGENVQIISQGASIGLWGILAGTPEDILKSARSVLNGDGFEYGTFVVDVVPASGQDFRIPVEASLTSNRWQHMQAAALSIPAKNQTEASQPSVCSMGWMRPADSACKGMDNLALSPSVHSRWDFGRRQRQGFYQRVTSLQHLPKFADEFADIASTTGVLSGKMAIFYADGNKFGSLQAQLCGTPAKQALWDHFIRSQRKVFLTRFLQEEVLPKNEWLNSKGEIRLETLLWGGDELMFVMPAKLGWHFATCFFQHFKGLDLKEASLPEGSPFLVEGEPPPAFESQPLTHAAALIFSQHHAPIERLKRLAKDKIAEAAKKVSRKRDQLIYTVLESFDHLGSDYEQAMRKRYGNAFDMSHLVLGASEDGLPLHERLARLSDTIKTLSDPKLDFARSQLRELVTLLIRPETAVPPPEDLAKAIEDYFFRTGKDGKEALKRLSSDFPHYSALLIHLEELWDYARP